MTVLAAIAVLAILIVVHELGHFLAARLQGIHVNRFSIGFGPILWKYQGPQTEYALRAIPLGGFVGFPDDDPDSGIPSTDPNLLKNRPILDRAIVISAGVIANLIFAYCVFVAQSTFVGISSGLSTQPGVFISGIVSQQSPAAQAGLHPGDVVIAVEDQTLAEGQSAIAQFMDSIQQHPNQPLDLTIQRGDRQIDVEVIPSLDGDGVARIGVQLNQNGTVEYRRANGIGEIFAWSAEAFQRYFLVVLLGFKMLITNFSEVAGQVSGPVGIVKQGADFAATDPTGLFPFTAIISINLAIINILPLPALDGGQLAFLLVEWLRGKPIPTRVQENVMQTGLILLLGLGIFLIVRDTTQLVQEAAPLDVLQNRPQ